jgi:hypothetical protein
MTSKRYGAEFKDKRIDRLVSILWTAAFSLAGPDALSVARAALNLSCCAPCSFPC